MMRGLASGPLPCGRRTSQAGSRTGRLYVPGWWQLPLRVWEPKSLTLFPHVPQLSPSGQYKTNELTNASLLCPRERLDAGRDRCCRGQSLTLPCGNHVQMQCCAAEKPSPGQLGGYFGSHCGVRATNQMALESYSLWEFRGLSHGFHEGGVMVPF